jgi:hypothetical protein
MAVLGGNKDHAIVRLRRCDLVNLEDWVVQSDLEVRVSTEHFGDSMDLCQAKRRYRNLRPCDGRGSPFGAIGQEP